MNQIIKSPTVITEKTGWTVFLAGQDSVRDGNGQHHICKSKIHDYEDAVQPGSVGDPGPQDVRCCTVLDSE